MRRIIKLDFLWHLTFPYGHILLEVVQILDVPHRCLEEKIIYSTRIMTKGFVSSLKQLGTTLFKKVARR